MYKYILDQKEFESENYKITGKQIFEKAQLSITDFELFIKINEGGYEPVALEEIIDLREAGKESFATKVRKMNFTIYVDDIMYKVSKQVMSANEILETSDKKVKDYYLMLLDGEIEISYKNDREYKIPIVDGMKFISYELEIIDVHEHCHNNIPVPPDCKYKIKINRVDFVVNEACMTGAEILSLTGETPSDRFQLRQKFKDGRVITIKNDQKVCFTEPGVEKFKTIACDQTEGKGYRKEFDLLEEDQTFLDSLNLGWESVNIAGAQWILIKDFKVQKGYNTDTVELGIRITSGYPIAQLDMLYFHPPLNRIDNQPINALSTLDLEGRTFQQWSRHRTGINPWRPDVDNLGTHIALADVWLALEFVKRPA